MKIVSLGAGRMTLVIKTVKGKKYVYEQYCHGNVVVTKCLGPLEGMVQVYQLYRSLGKCRSSASVTSAGSPDYCYRNMIRP